MATEVNRIARANNQFGSDVFNIVSKANDDGNVLVSPLSAHVVLSMAYQGAAGETLASMAKAFHLPEPEVTAEEYHQVISQLNKVESVTLDVANKIFVMEKFNLKPDFKKIMETKYMSEAGELNFADNVGSAKTINTWVEDKTNKKITDLIKADMLNAMTRLVLVNAVYFKGNWAKKFDREHTTKKPFYLLNGEEISVDMMHLSGKFRYSDNADLGCKFLEMPYVGNELSMVIILPNERNGVAQLQEKLAKTNLADVMQKMSQYTVIVDLPRFKIESTIPMKSVLEQMGAGQMFTNAANFSNMANEPLKVSDVIQKTFIEVNEEGAEAAAATGMIMMTRCMPMPLREERFEADHPFLVALVHKSTTGDSVLFYGRVANPQDN